MLLNGKAKTVINAEPMEWQIDEPDEEEPIDTARSPGGATNPSSARWRASGKCLCAWHGALPFTSVKACRWTRMVWYTVT